MTARFPGCDTSPRTLVRGLVRALLCSIAVCCVKSARADTLQTSAGEVIQGVVRFGNSERITVATGPKGEKLRRISLTDLVRATFEPSFDRGRRDPPLIDNQPPRMEVLGIPAPAATAASGQTSSEPHSGMIKLRAGYHRVLIVYCHTDGNVRLRLQYSFRHGSEERGLRIVPASALYHLAANGNETPSPGVDKDGYRIPETVKFAEPQISYQLRRAASHRLERVEDLLSAGSIIRSGSLERVTAGEIPENEENVAMLFAGYFRAASDGEYTFLLTSDGSSQMYFGPGPRALARLDASPTKLPWSIVLTGGERIPATLESWKDSKIRIQVRAGRSLVPLELPSENIAEIWANGAPNDDEKIDRADPPAKADLIYARSSSGRIQRVPGRIRVIDARSLRMTVDGEDRSIALAKVIGVILAADRANAAIEAPFHQVIETADGLVVPGNIVSLDSKSVVVRTLWGQKLTLDTDELSALSACNGKAISLTELKPTSVEQVSFFDRAVPYRIDESLSGGPILLRGGKCRHGISVYAKTVLRYSLGGKFRRFRTRMGFQLPEGALGDAAVRVTGDNQVLYDRPSLRGDGPVESLDVDVTGIGTLTLSVDFGRGQDVGDRVVWADPTLVRPAAGPLADEPGKRQK